eukprot:9471186-Pyramimonas_sp.AAC.1
MRWSPARPRPCRTAPAQERCARGHPQRLYARARVALGKSDLWCAAFGGPRGDQTQARKRQL